MKFIKVHPISYDDDKNPHVENFIILSTENISKIQNTSMKLNDYYSSFAELQLERREKAIGEVIHYGEYSTKISFKDKVEAIEVVEDIQYIWEQLNK